MDRLKSVLADKIIEIASENNDSSKTQLDKLNRFRDFSYACEALIKKYPRVEDELIRMIEANDFDTRVASSRVNNIISFAENENGLHAESPTASEIKLPETEHHTPEETPETFAAIAQPVTDYVEEPEVVSEREDIWKSDENANIEAAEDTTEAQPSLAEDAEVSQETVAAMDDAEDVATTPSSENPVSTYASSEDVNFEYSEENATATNLKRVLIVLAIVACVVLVYFLIKFVMHNWQTILIVLGIIAVAGGAIWFFAAKKNNNE